MKIQISRQPKKIFEVYFNKIEGFDQLDWDKIADKTPNVQGAVIAEIAKRACKLSQKEGHISTEIIIAAIASMKYQIELMNESLEQKDEAKIFMEKFQNMIANGVWETGPGKEVSNYVLN